LFDKQKTSVLEALSLGGCVESVVAKIVPLQQACFLRTEAKNLQKVMGLKGVQQLITHDQITGMDLYALITKEAFKLIKSFNKYTVVALYTVCIIQVISSFY